MGKTTLIPLGMVRVKERNDCGIITLTALGRDYFRVQLNAPDRDTAYRSLNAALKVLGLTIQE